MLAGGPLAFVVALLACGPLARRLRVGRPTAFLLVLGVTGILAITLIPQPGGPIRPTDAACLVPSLSIPAGGRLFPLGDESLNVVLFVPLGFALGLMAGHPLAARIAAVAVALPWIVEATSSSSPRSVARARARTYRQPLGLAFGVVTALAVRSVKAVAGGSDDRHR